MEGSSGELVVRARRGDAAAREAIGEAYRGRIGRYITTMVGDADRADDLAQECFSRAFARLDDLRDPERLGPWLYTIAVNLCRQHLKRMVDGSHPDRGRSLESDPVGPRRSILSGVVERETAEVLAVAIDRLPILLREAMVLHIVEGLAYAEIAEITGATVEALHVRTHRAKALLRKQLGSAVDTFWVEK